MTQVLGGLAISSSDDVVEVAPGLGATTRRVLDAEPATYTGVDRDPEAAVLVRDLLDGPARRVLNASAQATGLPDAIDDTSRARVTSALTSTINVSVSPRTISDWGDLSPSTDWSCSPASGSLCTCSSLVAVRSAS